MSGSLTTKPVGLKRYFYGFSTQNSAGNGVRTLYDIDLINQDLMNAFYTRVGERVMRPDYGCKLWDYVMEPLTAALHDAIVAEVARICALDARVVTQSINVTQDSSGQGFTIAPVLLYLPWNVVATFTATFMSNDVAYFGSTGITSA